MPQKKRCHHCATLKNVAAFGAHRKNTDGLRNSCLACDAQEDFEELIIAAYGPRKLQSQLRYYDLTDFEFRYLLSIQEERCGVCSEMLALNIDHDHSTGRVRGLLCNDCNLRLGRWCDKPPADSAYERYLANPPFNKCRK